MKKPARSDSDVEGMSDGFDRATAYGTIETHDDPSMGWARCVLRVGVSVSARLRC